MNYLTTGEKPSSTLSINCLSPYFKNLLLKQNTIEVSASAEELYKSFRKEDDDYCIIKSRRDKPTTLKNEKFSSAYGIAIFPDGIIPFNDGNHQSNSDIPLNLNFNMKFGTNTITKDKLCVAKFFDNTYKLPDMVILRGCLEAIEKSKHKDNELMETFTLFYLANQNVFDIAYNVEVPSSKAVDRIYSVLLKSIFMPPNSTQTC